MRTWLPALLIGLATGYAALELREMGWIIAAGVLILLPVVYFRQRRLADIGWLFFGAGLAPSFFLGRTLVETFTDPAIHVLADTWVFFAVGVVLAGAGIAIVVAAPQKQPTAS
jgi:uncharacterized membrane protein YczE